MSKYIYDECLISKALQTASTNEQLKLNLRTKCYDVQPNQNLPLNNYITLLRIIVLTINKR